MSKEMWSAGVFKTRPALGDVTNFVGKRGYTLISAPDIKTGDDLKKDEGLRVGKKKCRATENYKTENFQKEIVDSHYVWQPHSCSQIDSLKGNAIDGKAKVSCSRGVRHNADSDTIARSSNDVRLSPRSSPISLPTRLSDRIETENNERIGSEVVLKSNSKEQVETSITTNNGDDLTPHNSFNKGDYLDFSRILESQESRSSVLERSVDQKGAGCSSTGIDSIKACSCSFCMKAAYMLSDLHYQDTKGRIAAIKKSQKEASILVERNSRANEIGKYRQQISRKFSKLESDLTDKWSSFFLHMEDIFSRESNQLESSLLKLRVLREDCKSDLNPTDGMNLKKK